MVVKFVATQDRVVFGNRDFRDDYHSDVARDNGVPKSSVRGGGLADLAGRRIFGTSYGFGPYNVEEIRRLLPEWRVDQSSDY